jgi:hypothetical protein
MKQIILLPRPRIIRKPDIKIITLEQYWKELALDGRPLAPLDKPCKDCAVTCGLYTWMTKSLSKQPEDIQDAVSMRWDCHNDTRRACTGNINMLLKAKANKKLFDKVCDEY